MNYFCHKLSDVQTKRIGKGTKIWQFVVILEQAILGNNCNINAHVFIENDVWVGNNVTVKSGVQLWDGLRLEDNVFIGPNVTFTNDMLPRSKNTNYNLIKTTIRKGASIGANATILAGNDIGEYAMIGAGSTLTKSVGKHELWFGSPAKHRGYITKEGEILDLNLKSRESGLTYEFKNNKLIQV
jgi:acetyltransferase-like isoleucine patch superfamily enzyme